MKFIKNMAFMFRYSWTISPGRFLASLLEILLNSAEPFIYLIFPTFIINELTTGKDWHAVLLYIGLFIGCVVILRGLRLLFTVFINMSVNRSDIKDGMSYARHFMAMPYEKMEDEKVRNMQQTVSGHVRENGFVDMVAGFLTNLIQLAGFSYIILMLEPVVLLFILGLIVINYFLNKSLSKMDYKYQPTLAKYSRMFDYLYDTMTTFDYAKEVRVNKAKEILLGKFDKTLSRFDGDQKKFLRAQFFVRLLSKIVSFAQMLVSYGYVAYSAIRSLITVGEFNLYIGAIYNLSGSFNDVVARCIAFRYMSKYVDDYHDYIRTAMPQDAERETEELPPEDASLPMFSFENVSFVYPNTDKVVLDNISIDIYKGEKLSVVGLNGAGKTTFIKLLCRLYRPTKGTIKYYGVDISTIKKEAYYRLLAVVFQDYKIFSFSFMENIILNLPLDRDRLDRATENAGLEEKLSTLPRGMDTNIYRDFDEEGIEFSGGEGQKLVIARAYYKDASLVILDEPTAALDALAENEIYQNFHEITADKTAIFISHRLASTRFCDHIAVFSDGKIIEYGDHPTLVHQGGLYAQMFDKQAQYYHEEDTK